MIKVAVIVPIYNVEEYLAEALDSLMAQTYDCWHAFLIDDGSTDSSGRIADEYADRDSRFTVHHTQNSGLSAARNRGLDFVFAENSPFDAIAFLDSDDRFLPVLLEKAVRAMQSSKSEIVMFGYRTLQLNGKTSQKPFPFDSCLISVEEFHRAVYGCGVWEGKNATGGYCWRCLYSTQLVRNTRFPFEKDIVEDEPYLSRIPIRLGCFLLSEVLYEYRLRKNSLIHQPRASLKVFKSRLYILKELLAASMVDSTHVETVREGICRFHTHIHLRGGYSLSSDCLPILREGALAAYDTAQLMHKRGELPFSTWQYIKHLCRSSVDSSKSTRPTLSLILPANTDPQTFASVLVNAMMQSHRMEILCMLPSLKVKKESVFRGNDISYDYAECLRLAEQAASEDSRIRIIPYVIFGDSHDNISAAWNASIAHATGEFVIFLRPGMTLADTEVCSRLATILSERDADSAIFVKGAQEAIISVKFQDSVEEGRILISPKILPLLSPTVTNKAFRLDNLKIHGIRFQNEDSLAESVFVLQYFSVVRMSAWIEERLCPESKVGTLADTKPEEYLRIADSVYDFQKKQGLLNKTPLTLQGIASSCFKKALAATPSVRLDKIRCLEEIKRLLLKWQLPLPGLWVLWYLAHDKKDRSALLSVFSAETSKETLLRSFVAHASTLTELRNNLATELKKEKKAHAITSNRVHAFTKQLEDTRLRLESLEKKYSHAIKAPAELERNLKKYASALEDEKTSRAQAEEHVAKLQVRLKKISEFNAIAYLKSLILARIFPTRRMRHRFEEQQMLYDLLRKIPFE